MYKALLVDDEIFDLEGLEKFIPWGDLKINVVGSVNSGFEALEFIEKSKIDILITDIRMPIMLGWELAQKVRSRYPEVKIIFISGYEDFQYAKKAIDLGVSGYVLKPVVDSEFIEVIEDLVEKLDSEREKNQMEKHFINSLSLAKNELLHQLLEGATDISMDKAIMASYNIKLSGNNICAVICEIDRLNAMLENCSADEKNKLCDDVYNFISVFINEVGLGEIVRLELEKTAIVCDVLNLNRDESLKKLISSIKNTYGITVTIGVGSEVKDINNIKMSYYEALDALEYKMFLGRGQVISISELKASEVQNICDLDGRVNKLFTAMASYEVVDVYDLMEEIFDHLIRYRSKSDVYNSVMHIIYKLENYMTELDENLSLICGENISSIDKLLKFETVEDIKKWLRMGIYRVSEHLNNKKQKRNRKLIDEIEKYIQEKIEDKLTLREVAENFAFSPNYLGFIFKEETGQNFSEYLILKRLERARELLRNPRLKIYEVADRIGYKNSDYFSKQFKECFGVTPVEYRETGGKR